MDGQVCDMTKQLYSKFPSGVKVQNLENKRNERQLVSILNFDKSILYKKYFGKQLMELVVGYILNSKKITNKSLISPKVERLTDNFIQMFMTIQDPYQRNIRLMSINEMNEYGNQAHTKNINLEERIAAQGAKLDALLGQTTRGLF